MTLTVYYLNSGSPHLACLVHFLLYVDKRALTESDIDCFSLPDEDTCVSSTEWFLTLTRQVMGRPTWRLRMAALLGVINELPSHMLLQRSWAGLSLSITRLPRTMRSPDSTFYIHSNNWGQKITQWLFDGTLWLMFEHKVDGEEIHLLQSELKVSFTYIAYL